MTPQQVLKGQCEPSLPGILDNSMYVEIGVLNVFGTTKVVGLSVRLTNPPLNNIGGRLELLTKEKSSHISETDKAAYLYS